MQQLNFILNLTYKQLQIYSPQEITQLSSPSSYVSILDDRKKVLSFQGWESLLTEKSTYTDVSLIITMNNVFW